MAKPDKTRPDLKRTTGVALDPGRTPGNLSRPFTARRPRSAGADRLSGYFTSRAGRRCRAREQSPGLPPASGPERGRCGQLHSPGGWRPPNLPPGV